MKKEYPNIWKILQSNATKYPSKTFATFRNDELKFDDMLIKVKLIVSYLTQKK